MGLQYVNLTYRAGDWMAINEQRLALANRVTGNESPEELLAIHQADKGLTLAGEKAKIDEEVGYAMQSGAEERKRKARQQRQNLFSMGAIFA